ncbi:MAG: DNA helicase RecQ [Bacteroidia bacterium]
MPTDTLATPTTDLKIHLQKYFGFNKFKGQQEAVITNLMEGKDTFVIMPTGGGKSMCYQLPALIQEGTCIVVSPLIALMKNQVDALRNVSEQDGIAHFLNSSLNKTEITRVKNDIKSGVTKLLYVAPESLTKDENIAFFKEIKISFFAIDEAHCISEWGHDFRPEYRRLRSIIEAIGTVPIIALTATATPKVQQDIMKNLGMENAILYKSSFNRDNLYYEVRPKTSNVNKDIIKYIKGTNGKSGIIYCLSRKKVEELAQVLKVNGINASPYHAGLEAKERAGIQDAFLMEDLNVIVATIAFGMGIDKPDVRFVIHYDMPKSLEGYYQETGRAGRDGGEGNCIAFYAQKDIDKLEKFLNGKPVAEQEIGKELISEVVAFAECSSCRRKQLLNYFGEVFNEEGCNKMCDSCLYPKEKFEAEEDICLLLDTIAFTKQQFKDEHLIHIITGTENSVIKQFKHDKLKLFGKGSKNNAKHWGAVVRQTIVNGFLEKDVEAYGLLKITDKGNEFMEKPYSIKFTKDHDFEVDVQEDEDSEAGAGKGGGVADETLFAMLKDLRKKIAKQKQVPPFVVFQDPSLEDMATQYPITMDDMKNITGVGTGKAVRFGKEFIELIAKYVAENEIERAQDMVVKSVVNKSGLKVHIIQNIDKKIGLNDIARAKGIKIDELISEVEHIVSSGTKVNINYYINDVMDEDKQEEIFDYFKECETDSVSEALAELGGDFEESEIRLMRIKFISELGN